MIKYFQNVKNKFTVPEVYGQWHRYLNPMNYFRTSCANSL